MPNLVGYLGSFPLLRTIFRIGEPEERLNFARCDRSETELCGDETTVSADQNNDVVSFPNGKTPFETFDGIDTEGPEFAKIPEDKVAATEAFGPRTQITEWQAGWNVTNAIQGMFIVSFPYAVLQGGYWAIFAMIIIAHICCHTGKILVDCLYEVNEFGQKVRVRNSYVEIAEVVWGKRFGGRIVNIAQIIELLMTCILYLVLCGDLLIGSFPNTPLNLTSWIMVSSIMLLPCAFLKSLRAVSWLSFWCTVAHMFINAIILIYCFTKATEWQFSKVQIKIDIWTFPISLGIVVFSYTSQIFLPSLEGNLRDRSKFSCMMHWTHVAAAVFKAIFSYVCFITWGDETKEVITNNLPSKEFKVIVNLILVAKALLSFPLPYYAAVELLQTSFFSGRPFPSCFDGNLSIRVWGLALRLGLVVVTLVLAIIIPHFALLMGLIGSFTGTMLSFVWPCVFHFKIKGPQLRLHIKVFDIIIIFLGVICGVIGIYYSGHALIRALQGLSPEPGAKTVPIIHPPFGTGGGVIESIKDNFTDFA